MAVKGSNQPGVADPGFVPADAPLPPLVGEERPVIAIWNGTEWEYVPIDSKLGVPFPYTYNAADSTLLLGVNNPKLEKSNNSGLGINTIISLEEGESNVAVGSTALAFLKKGNQNTAVGASAMYDDLEGNDNVGIGYDTLSSQLAEHAIVHDNVAVGSQALAIIKGEMNQTTAIGYRAGFESAGNGNVLIGYKATPTDGAGNKLTIGNALRNLIYGDFNAGYVAIDGTLYVVGEIVQEEAPICFREQVPVHTINIGGPVEVVNSGARKNSTRARVSYTAPLWMSWNATSEGGYIATLLRDGEPVQQMNVKVGVGAIALASGVIMLQHLQEAPGTHTWQVTIEVYGTEAKMELQEGMFEIAV